MQNLILVIEDEDQIRENISDVLNSQNFQTLLAKNGKEGINLANKHLPDLIICDIMMPELDGYDVLSTLQSQQETASIPFLFLTAKSSKDDIRMGMNLGADDYLTKPFEFEDLLSAVNSRLKKSTSISQNYKNQVEDLKSSIHRNIPHEIRTPLLAILGNAELIKKSSERNGDKNTLEMATDIEVEGNRLLNLFENFILFSELQIIKSNLDEVLRLKEYKTILMENIIKTVANRIAQKYNRESDIKFYLNDYNIKIKDEHFEKIIEAITDNAFKFSNTGTKVEIFTSKMNNQLLLTVKDSGKGMSKYEIANLSTYQQFRRDKQEQKGIGLGLALTNLIVDLYGGEIEIRSVGASTSVHIYLNLAF